MEETSNQLKEFEERLQHIESQNEEMIAVLHFLRKTVYYSRVWAIIKIVIIVIPLLLSIIYLPSFLRASFDNFFSNKSPLNTLNLPINSDRESFFE